MEITLSIRGLDEYIKKIEATKKEKDMSVDFWKKVGDVVIKNSITRSFEHEMTPWGKKWRRWSDSYTERMKRAGKGGNKILQDTGSLRSSIRAKPTKSMVYIGSKLRYAARHQFGDKKNSGGFLIARPYLGVTDNDKARIKNMCLQFFTRRLKGL